MVSGKSEGARGAHRGRRKENVSPEPLACKMRRAKFREFLPSAGLKAGSFKGQQAWLR